MSNQMIRGLDSVGVSEYYKNKTIFITGGTGFIGKVIVEKLLRCCHDLKAVYFLIRPKKGQRCVERIDKIFALPLFQKLHETNPNAREKIIPIPGDITHKFLGISDGHRQLLIQQCDIIIHSAATIKFNEPIRVAMHMNVIAVKELIALAKSCQRLKVFCHISTAYSQIDRSSDDLIQEKFYPVSVNPEKIIEAMDWMSDKMMDSFTTTLLGKFPNTYTFTKNLAEYLFQKETSLPLVIVRPSIVCSSIKDPFPGWVDSYSGLTGLVVSVGRGILRSIHVPHIRHDIVPVDLVSNCIIVSTWYRGVSRSKDSIICNCTSGNQNPTCVTDMGEVLNRMFVSEYPLVSIFRRPNFSFSNRFLNQYWKLISHYLPAILLDGFTLLIGKKPRFTSLYRAIDAKLSTLDHFIKNEWTWDNRQFLNILNAIPREEKGAFNFDMKEIVWRSYYENMILGIKKYLVKEDMSEISKAKKIHLRYKLVRWLSSTLCILVTCRFFFLKSERFRKIWFEVLFAMSRLLQYFRIKSVTWNLL